VATYAIGDIQGCAATFERLIERIAFDPAHDRLWLTGDLVNRGPASLEVLRRVRALGDSAVTVLGNHDLHLIGRAVGTRRARTEDTLDGVLAAPDCDALVAWLRSRPLIHREGNLVLVHAGLASAWTPDEAVELARAAEVEIVRRPARVLGRWHGSDAWDEARSEDDRTHFVLRAMTRIRFCHRDGRLVRGNTGPPETAADGLVPWFDVPGRRSAEATIIVGHWAALGLRLRPDLIAIDTGCVWGGTLTAVRLEDRRVFSEPLADR